MLYYFKTSLDFCLHFDGEFVLALVLLGLILLLLLGLILLLVLVLILVRHI